MENTADVSSPPLSVPVSVAPLSDVSTASVPVSVAPLPDVSTAPLPDAPPPSVPLSDVSTAPLPDAPLSDLPAAPSALVSPPAALPVVEPRRKRAAAVSHSSRAGLLFPVSRVRRHLRAKYSPGRVTASAAVYLTGVLEYLCAEMLATAGDAAKERKQVRIDNRCISLALQNDREMLALVHNAIIPGGGVLPNPAMWTKPQKPKKEEPSPKKRKLAK